MSIANAVPHKETACVTARGQCAGPQFDHCIRALRLNRLYSDIPGAAVTSLPGHRDVPSEVDQCANRGSCPEECGNAVSRVLLADSAEVDFHATLEP